MWKRILLLLIIITSITSCSSKGKTYRIGIDSSWYPLNLMGKETNVYTFVDELFRSISAEEGVFFERININWDNIISSLKKREYEGMLSSISPRTSMQTIYSFSDLFLNTGPVLVVRHDTKVSTLGNMSGKEIAVDSLQGEALLMNIYPEVNVHYYSMIAEGLNALITEDIDGVLIDYIPAKSYIQDLYYGKVKIASPPLNNQGLRLLTLHGENQDLIDVFNRGLSKLCENGGLEKLLKKWNLN